MWNKTCKTFIVLMTLLWICSWFLYTVERTDELSPSPIVDKNKPAVEFKDPPPVPSAFPMKRKLTQKAIQQAHIDFMAKRFVNCCVVRNQSEDSRYKYCGSAQARLDERNVKLKKLGEKVQAMIGRSQNPQDCTAAKYLILLSGHSGEGSQIHKIMVALAIALNSNRVLILDKPSFQKRYDRTQITHFYKSLSSCTIPENINIKPNQGETDPTSPEQYIQLQHRPAEGLQVKLLDEIPAIPLEIAKELVVLHTRPNLWWDGQLVAYVTRLNSTLEKEMSENMEKKVDTPFNVGLHVRRTDKVKITNIQPLSRYIQQADQYLQTIGLDDKADIYVASDDSDIHGQFVKSYPTYKFHHSTLAKERLSAAGEYSLLSDLYMLIHSDFIVCTLSSNICRYAFEMLQYQHGDVTHCLKTLDTQYAIGLQLRQYRIAVQDYTLSIPINRTKKHPLTDQDVRHILRDVFDECRTDLPINKYPFYITEDSINVSLVRKGDKILLLKYFKHILNGKEHGENLRTNLKICYPKSITVDYISIR